MNADLKYLNAFNLITGVGPASLRAIKKHFGSFEAAWKASDSAMLGSPLDKRAIESICFKRQTLNPDQEAEALVKKNIWVIAENDPGWPPLLKEIPSPPLILYGKGNVSFFENCFAVVGTRRPTAYGLEAAETLTAGLAGAGLTIISGLASGIDSRAHQTVLEAKGKTIAVLGSGLDQKSIFPPENRGLAKRITESGGTLISEYAPGTPAVKEHFPQRNRIISGLSLGVLVIEARQKSGALITARFALEQNREVFALPGSIFSPTSLGANQLIREGAKPAVSAETILEELGIKSAAFPEKPPGPTEKKERLLFELLEEPADVDFLKGKTGMETSIILSALAMLELNGKIRNLGGGTYQKI